MIEVQDTVIEHTAKMLNQHTVDKKTRSQSTSVIPKFSWNVGGMLSRDQSPRANIWGLHGTYVFVGLPATASTLCEGMLNPWDSHVTGSIPVRTSTEKPVAVGGEQSRDMISTPRFLRRPSAKESFNPMEGRSLMNYGCDGRQHFTITATSPSDCDR